MSCAFAKSDPPPPPPGTVACEPHDLSPVMAYFRTFSEQLQACLYQGMACSEGNFLDVVRHIAPNVYVSPSSYVDILNST